MIPIQKEESIYSLVIKYPIVKDIMIELGFTDIVKPGLLQSIGRIMNLKKGSEMKNIHFDIIIETFQKYGFEVV